MNSVCNSSVISVSQRFQYLLELPRDVTQRDAGIPFPVRPTVTAAGAHRPLGFAPLFFPCPVAANYFEHPR